jgi:phosphohistidine phosphatase
MDLILWRHAEAEDGWDDLARALTAHGRKQAAKMAAWLLSNIPKQTRIIASPAVRTQQTVQALDLPYETVSEIAPGARVSDVLHAAGWSMQGAEHEGTVLVVGHQPTLGMTAGSLLCGQTDGFAMKKCAIVWVRQRDERRGMVLLASLTPEML